MKDKIESTERVVNDILTKLQRKGFMYHENIGRNGRITSFSHYVKIREIEIIFTSGYALNEEKQKLYFSEDELEKNVAYFTAAKDTPTTFSRTIPDSEINGKNEVKTIITPAIIPTKKMEDNNTNALTDEAVKNNFGEMRKSLFEALRKLEKGELKPETAKAMSQTAQTIINSVKVELEVRLQQTKLPTMPVIN